MAKIGRNSGYKRGLKNIHLRIAHLVNRLLVLPCHALAGLLFFQLDIFPNLLSFAKTSRVWNSFMSLSNTNLASH